MLAVTENAIEAIKALTAGDDVPEGTGLRIAAQDEGEQEALAVTLQPGPSEDDQVLSGEGTQLFLESGAATYLDDKVLDAQVSEEGQVSFAIGQQDDQQEVAADDPEQAGA